MFDFSSLLFWYRLVVLFELFTFNLLLFNKLKKKSHYVIRLIIGIIISFLIVFCTPIVAYNWFYTSLTFFIIFILSLLVSLLVYDEPFTTILFCTLDSYIFQHISYQLFLLIKVITDPSSEANTGIYGNKLPTNFASILMDAFIYVLCFLLFLFIAYVTFGKRIKKDKQIQIQKPVISIICVILIFSSVVVNSIYTYNFYQNEIKSPLILNSFLMIIVCVLCLLLQFESFNKVDLKQQLDIANHIIREEKSQYEKSKTNIELINIKCHDLKHKINMIENLNSKDAEEINKIINIYDSTVKSGNITLDTILTEKTLECQAKNIPITCLIDGKDLSFMEDVDLYVLFANAFDNAIEASNKLPNEKRGISLTSTKKGKMLFIALKNNCLDNIKFENGSPITTKEDKEHHGFGTRSIKRIVEKYNGNVIFDVDNGVFILSITLPL